MKRNKLYAPLIALAIAGAMTVTLACHNKNGNETSDFPSVTGPEIGDVGASGVVPAQPAPTPDPGINKDPDPCLGVPMIEDDSGLKYGVLDTDFVQGEACTPLDGRSELQETLCVENTTKNPITTSVKEFYDPVPGCRPTARNAQRLSGVFPVVKVTGEGLDTTADGEAIIGAGKKGTMQRVFNANSGAIPCKGGRFQFDPSNGQPAHIVNLENTCSCKALQLHIEASRTKNVVKFKVSFVSTQAGATLFFGDGTFKNVVDGATPTHKYGVGSYHPYLKVGDCTEYHDVITVNCNDVADPPTITGDIASDVQPTQVIFSRGTVAPASVIFVPSLPHTSGRPAYDQPEESFETVGSTTYANSDQCVVSRLFTKPVPPQEKPKKCELEAIKTGPQVSEVNGYFYYDIAIKNVGDKKCKHVKVKDVIPSEVQAKGEDHSNNGHFDGYSSGAYWWSFYTLDINETGWAKIKVKVHDHACGTWDIVNVASIKADGVGWINSDPWTTTVEKPCCDEPSFWDQSIEWNKNSIKANVHVRGNGNFVLQLYATSKYSEYEDNDPDYTKDTDSKNIECRGQGELKVDYSWKYHPSRWWWAALYVDGTRVWKSDAVDKWSAAVGTLDLSYVPDTPLSE